jgi:hypothetical protein
VSDDGKCLFHGQYVKDLERMEILQLEQTRILQEVTRKLAKGEVMFAETSRRVDNVEQQNAIIQDLTINVSNLVVEIKHLVDTVSTHDTDINTLKSVPGDTFREYKLIFVGALVGMLLSLVPTFIK